MNVGEGTNILHFQLTRELGSGSFAEVWEAYDTKLCRNVAIKILGERASDTSVQTFRAEARSVAKLKHPGIVEVYEIIDDLDHPILVLEYVDGVTLKEWCRFADLTYVQIAELIMQTAEAVQHAHQRGVIHRDLKPANILVDLGGKIHVTDFGLAANLEVLDGLQDASVGTLAYVSPEQANAGQIGPSSDVFSLGAILFELLTGRLPFQGVTRSEFRAALANTCPPACRSINPHIPSGLAAICDKCLHVDQSKRFQSAMEFADELHRFQKRLDVKSENIGTLRRAIKSIHRHQVKVLASVIMLLLAGGLIFAMVQFRQLQTTADRHKVESQVESLISCKSSSVIQVLSKLALQRKRQSKYLKACFFLISRTNAFGWNLENWHVESTAYNP
jgi:eukaryotic-like serine/threonine-protein kinase